MVGNIEEPLYRTMRPAFDVTEHLLEADLPVGESAANQQEGSDRGIRPAPKRAGLDHGCRGQICLCIMESSMAEWTLVRGGVRFLIS